MNHHRNNRRKPAETASESSKVIAISGDSPLRPNPPKSAFIPRYQQEAWYEAWRSGQVTITTLCQRNRGIGRNDIENALRSEMDRRDAVRERVLDRQAGLRWGRAA